MADQAGMIGLSDFTGLFAALGSPQGGFGFALSEFQIYFLYGQQRQRMREAEENARKVELMLTAYDQAIYTKRYNEWRRNWASTYTTLLAEV